MSAQMRQYPLLNFTMAKSACAGAVAVRPSASAPIAKRNFFLAHCPLCGALLPPLSCLRSEGLSQSYKGAGDCANRWLGQRDQAKRPTSTNMDVEENEETRPP